MQKVTNYLLIIKSNRMKRILFFLSIFFVSNLFGQSTTFLLQVRNEFNGTNQLLLSNGDSIFIREKVIIDLSVDTLIEYEIRGAPIYVGKISYSDFSGDKEKWINHFHNLVLGSVSPDYEIIYYEIESDLGKGQNVHFYYYETRFSGFLPDKLTLSNGYYNLSILSNGTAIKSVPILIQNMSIVPLSN